MLDEIDEMELLASMNPEPDVTGNPWEPDDRAVPAVEISESDAATSGGRARRRRIVLAAAAIAVVVGAIGVAVSNAGDDGPSRVGTDGPTPTTTAPSPPVGEEISVTPDAIRFGDGLVGMSHAEDDGRLYLVAGRVRSDADLLFAPEEAVLAAFDDAGRELWRTVLDGGPGDVVVTDGDLWVSRRGMLSRIDAADGRVLGDVTVDGMTGFVGAFGSLWVGSIAPSGPGELLRIESDLSTTTIEIPLFDGAGLQLPRAGAGAVWFPLQGRGLALIDPDTNGVTLIPVEDIGHAVMAIAFDGDVAYVTDSRRVTSIVDGEVLATVAPGPISYLGPIDGVFGVQLEVDFEASPQFVVLQPNDPMVVATRQIAPIPEQAGTGLTELDGDAWLSTGRNGSLRRAELLPVSAGDG